MDFERKINGRTSEENRRKIRRNLEVSFFIRIFAAHKLMYYKTESMEKNNYKKSNETEGGTSLSGILVSIINTILSHKWISGLFIICLAVSFFFCRDTYNSTVVTASIPTWAYYVVFIGLGVLITLFATRKHKFEYKMDLFFFAVLNTLLVFCASVILSSAVFATNKYLGQKHPVEKRVKILGWGKDYHIGSRGRSRMYYIIYFRLPTSTATLSWDVRQDASYLHSDSCTVVYHTGCLGMDVIDGVKH